MSVSEYRPQLVTRLPAVDGIQIRPGQWVKVVAFSPQDPLSGAVVRVKSITCSVTAPEQKRGLWRVHLENGRWIAPCQVARLATSEEIRKASR